MTVAGRIRWILAGVAIGLLLLWFLRDSLSPFLAGAAVAYLLDPLADRLAERGIPRTLAAFLVMLFACLAAVAALLLLVPVLVAQIATLIEGLPALAVWLQGKIAALGDTGIGGSFGAAITDRVVQSVDSLGPTLGVETLRTALAGGVALVDALAFAVVTPVVGFYLLVDWDRIVARIDGLIPRGAEGTIREIAVDIDRTLSAFVRGQLLVCVILAVFYALALSLTGLEYAVVIGMTAGLVSFIPYVGTGIGFGVSIIVALVQFYPDPLPILAVAAVFGIGQLAESYVLSPRLVGRSVGLHPVWLLFALIAGGNLFGFPGLLVAVPVAASIGVLARFGETRYRASRLYEYRQADPPATDGKEQD